MAIPLRHDVEYPESDGQPMAESDIHRREMIDLITGLEDHLRDRPDVYVAGNLFVYHQKGDARAVVAPDVFVVFGVPKGNRKAFKVWEEGAAPGFVIEVTSDSTREDDLERKRDLYERLGVEEYFLHDPLGDYLDPALLGFRLSGRRYAPLQPGRQGELASRTTGLTLRPEGQRLRLLVTATGEPLLWVDEAREMARRWKTSS